MNGRTPSSLNELRRVEQIYLRCRAIESCFDVKKMTSVIQLLKQRVKSTNPELVEVEVCDKIGEEPSTTGKVIKAQSANVVATALVDGEVNVEVVLSNAVDTLTTA